MTDRTATPPFSNAMKAAATGCLIFAVSIAGFGITRAEVSEPVAPAETAAVEPTTTTTTGPAPVTTPPSTEAAPQSEPTETSDDEWIDPFADLTDEEFVALSEEEFNERLKDAGIDPDDVEIIEGDPDDFDAGDGDGDGDIGAPAATLAVDGDTIDTSGLDPKKAEIANRIWNRFAQLIPAEHRAKVTTFELTGDDFGGAYVAQNDDNAETWTLGVSDGLGESLDAVLIHEFGHLVTLDNAQVDYSGGENASGCRTYFTGDSCANDGSIINPFVERFWSEELRNEIDRIEAIEDEAEYEAARQAFAEKNADNFVTDYASGNPAEDLAEVFSKFVTEDKPTGSTIADQKILLLWDYPELVKLRGQILANAGGDLETYESDLE